MILKKLRYCILLLAFCFSSQAQIYPVQVNTALIPPYLTTISDYSTTLNEKFVANLFTSDLTVSQRQIQLKLYIEGNNIQTTSTAIINGYQPLYLNGGESLRLTNVDLEAYFRLENLQGINPNVYGNSLPQGLYKFCIEVIDYNTQIKISQKSCAMAYFIVNDPPFLNLPSNHENIPSQDPQNIVFTWTPRHLNATNIEYEYTLVDLQDNQAPSNYAFVVTPPLFQATTNNTILLYGPSQPLLTIGKKYAWRVQAKTQSGFGDTAAFQNNGYSEIYDFVFQGNCDKPTFVLAEALSNSQVKITWQTNPNHLNYIVQYRKKDTNQWFDIEATTNEVKLYDLEPLAVYEFRVGGYCTGNILTFSNTNEFTQPANNVNVVNCGISPDIDLSNQQIYSGNLGEGETFLAGDFPVHVTESTNASGTYSGKGWTKAPYLNSIRLAVLFTNVKLNTDKKMLAGEVKAVYDPTWSNIADINVIVDQVENVLDIFQQSNDVHTHSVPFVIGSATNITVVNGQIVVVNSATGQTGATYDHDTGEMTTITDANGNVYTVSPTGQVQQVGVGIGIPSATNTENVATNGSVTALSNVGIQVTFKKSNVSGKESIAAEDKGFSSLAPAKIKALYKIIKDGQNADYPLYYKAIINAENGDASYEYVIAEIKITDNNIKIDSLIFNKKGVKVIAENLSNQGTIIRRLLKIPAFTTIGEEEVLALLKNGNQKQKVVGAMIAVPIKDVGAVNVTLIPVNGATITASTKTQLNAIYAGTGARLNTTIAANYSSTKTTLDCGSSGFFANYTSDQKAFIDAYKLANPAQSDQYYIFVTKNISPTGRQLNGFMPLHRQFGFVFSDQTTGNEVKSDDVSGLASVIAHELGHGAFELEHPWEKFKYTKGTGTTAWLMDYEKGTQIPFSDWQTISHPKTKLYIFQGDESGDFGKQFALTPNYQFIYVENCSTINIIKESQFPYGTLPGFVLNVGTTSEKRFSWNSSENTYTNDANQADKYPANLILDYILPETKFRLFYNLNRDCNGGSTILLKHNEATTLWSASPADKAIKLLSLINNNLQKSVRIACSSSTNTSNSQEWKIMPIDCSASNVESLISAKIATITNAINAGTTFANLEPIFKANISTCVLEKLTLVTRKAILDKYFTITEDRQWEIDYFPSNDYFFIKDVILETPDVDKKAMLLYLNDSGKNWIAKLYEFGKTWFGEDNDVTPAQVIKIFLELGDWSKRFSQQDLNYTPNKSLIFSINGTDKYNLEMFAGEIPFFIGKSSSKTKFQIDGKEYQIINTEVGINSTNKLKFLNNYADGVSYQFYTNPYGGSYQPMYDNVYNYDNSFHPYEMVTIIAPNKNLFGLVGNKEYVVPAIQAFAMQWYYTETEKSANLEKLGNVAMIVGGVIAAPFSGGSSIAGVAAALTTAGIVVGSTDLVINEMVENEQINVNSNYYKYWKDLKLAYTIVEGGVNLTSLGYSGLTKLNTLNFSKSFNKFNSINTANDFAKGSFTTLKNTINTGLTSAKDLQFFNGANFAVKNFKKFTVAALFSMTVSLNASDNIYSLTKVADNIELIMNLVGKIKPITPSITSTINSAETLIETGLSTGSNVLIKTTPTSVGQIGKIAMAEVGDLKIVAYQLNNQIIYNVLAISGTTISIYQDTRPINNQTTPCPICPDRTVNKPLLCELLGNIKIKYPTKTTAINKLCLVTDLQAVASKINLMPITLGNQFLSDIDETCTNDKAICSHIANIDVSIIEAWEKITVAKSSGFRKDWLSLMNLKNLTTTEIQNLQGNASISELMTKNSRQPCGACQNTATTKDYLQPLNEYLLDLKYFSQFHNKDGFVKAITLLKSTTLAQKLEPEAFIIKLIKSENLSVEELEKGKIGCEPDVILADGTICEFKSWRINPSDLQEENEVEEEDYLFDNTISSSYDKSKTQFENFKAGHTGVKQFISYLALSDVSNLTKLRYYFDAKKGATKTYAKNVFKQMMMQNNVLTFNGNQIFNTIWANVGLRSGLFPNLSNADAKNEFTNIINDTNNSFYNFIYIK